MDVLMYVLSGVAGYLLGSLNSSLIVGRFYGVDIRKHGSGNAGTTNTLRVLGKKAALFVLLGDILKGVASYLIGLAMAGNENGAMIAGTAAVIGHNWPVYFGFKGGKGALTSIAVVLMMDWRIGLILIGVFAVIVATTRYVSLGSIVSALFFPLLALLVFEKGTEFVVVSLFLTLVVVGRHRANIERLFKGTESKLGQKSGEREKADA